MIQVRLDEIQVRSPNESSNLLHTLNNHLHKTGYCGKIILTFKDGFLEYVKMEQGFTVDSLKEALSH